MIETRLQAIAFYLPQYHPIPENDDWWGKGFTEWTNVARAKPLYRGHRQPKLPSDLGFYDLRVPETREEQAAIAQRFGVNGFCYYHYWFGGGKRLLERPFNEVLSTGKPNFPFMLCWANQTWSGVWHGLANTVLIEQKYPSLDDELKHFSYLSPAFRDHRYIRVNDKPVFMVYQPEDLPDPVDFAGRWREMSIGAGFDGLYLIGAHSDPFWDSEKFGFDAFVHQPYFPRRRTWTPWTRPIEKIRNKWLDFTGKPTVSNYESMITYFVPDKASSRAIPCVVPNWDNTPRSGRRGFVLEGETPQAFGRMIDRALVRNSLRGNTDGLLFIKSWNEWAEGNHLEPGNIHQYGHLEQLKRRLC